MNFWFNSRNGSMSVKENNNISSLDIEMTGQHGTNLFNSPQGSFRVNNFPFYYTEAEGDFLFRCKIAPEFNAMYDNGNITVFADENRWIKFAYEKCDSGNLHMVAVITRELSDDSVGIIMNHPVWMQITRKDNTFALHYSEDCIKWELVRIFNIDLPHRVQVGVSAQSPMGTECKVDFEGIALLDNPYNNLRQCK